MTVKDKKLLAAYTREIADKVGLADWTFELFFNDDEMEPDKSHVNDEHPEMAEHMPIIGQRHALIRYSPSLRAAKLDEVRHIVVHELMHNHFSQMHELCRTALVTHLSQQGYDLFMHAFDVQWEHAIDAIAVSWAKTLPLIDWREERRGRSERQKAPGHRS